MHHVFVYGTLLSGACNPASRLVGAEVLGPATVPGAIYDLGWYPGFKQRSVIEGESLVKGELITVDDEGLQRLDAYEGYPDLYSRVEITAVSEELAEAVPAYIYVYNGNVNDGDIIPDGDFIAHEAREDGGSAFIKPSNDAGNY